MTAPLAPCARSTTGRTDPFGLSIRLFRRRRRTYLKALTGRYGLGPRSTGHIIRTTPMPYSEDGMSSAGAPWRVLGHTDFGRSLRSLPREHPDPGDDTPTLLSRLAGNLP